MKGFLILFLLISVSSYSQDKTRGTIKVRKGGCVVSATDKFVYTKVDSMPDFPGGGQKGDEWMRKNLVFPPLAEGMFGMVVVSFVVKTDGSITNPRIISSTSPAFNSEAMRLVNKMPKWKPGKCNGEVVAVQYTMPMRFHFPIN